jgi:hypothetical protein
MVNVETLSTTMNACAKLAGWEEIVMKKTIVQIRLAKMVPLVKIRIMDLCVSARLHLHPPQPSSTTFSSQKDRG